MKAQEVCSFIAKQRLVPVVRAPSGELALAAASALLEGGVRIFEITLTVPGATSVITKLRAISDSLGDDSAFLVGAGTVRSGDEARSCIDAGAQFVVSPGVSPGVIQVCRGQDIAVLSGALTPTEVMCAWDEGADIVKIFPCSALGGASYLKALKSPFPEILMMPTGGVELGTVSAFLHAGAVALGVGSNLVDIDGLVEKGPSHLVSAARKYVEAVKNSGI